MYPFISYCTTQKLKNPSALVKKTFKSQLLQVFFNLNLLDPHFSLEKFFPVIKTSVL